MFQSYAIFWTSVSVWLSIIMSPQNNKTHVNSSGLLHLVSEGTVVCYRAKHWATEASVYQCSIRVYTYICKQSPICACYKSMVRSTTCTYTKMTTGNNEAASTPPCSRCTGYEAGRVLVTFIRKNLTGLDIHHNTFGRIPNLASHVHITLFLREIIYISWHLIYSIWYFSFVSVERMQN